jgi:hypothetical protein
MRPVISLKTSSRPSFIITISSLVRKYITIHAVRQLSISTTDEPAISKKRFLSGFVFREAPSAIIGYGKPCSFHLAN